MFIGSLSVYKIGSFSESLVSNWNKCMKCVSLINHWCQARQVLDNIKSDENFLSNYC